MADIKELIAARVAKELKDGDVVNLGIGLPTMVATCALFARPVPVTDAFTSLGV